MLQIFKHRFVVHIASFVFCFCILPCGLCCSRGYVAFILYECEVCGTASRNPLYRL